MMSSQKILLQTFCSLVELDGNCQPMALRPLVSTPERLLSKKIHNFGCISLIKSFFNYLIFRDVDWIIKEDP